MQDVTSVEEFKSLIDTGDAIVVDFWASWCGPCRNFMPIVEEVEAEIPEVTFVKVNVEDVEELSAEYGIRMLPTLVFFQHGGEVNRIQGQTSKAILAETVTQLLTK